MPISNLNNDHFSFEDMQKINIAWETILEVLTRKTRNLSPEERQKYGSISEENKLIVQKVLDYNKNQGHLSSPDVDYAELNADWTDRMFLASFVSRMEEGTNIANNIRVTHDFDAYQNSLLDYDYTKYKMNTAPGAGFESKYKDLLYFFTAGPGAKENKKTPETPDSKKTSETPDSKKADETPAS